MAVAGYERKLKVEGSCSDNAVRHVGNNVAWNIVCVSSAALIV